jgi:hypothetical protein
MSSRTNRPSPTAVSCTNFPGGPGARQVDRRCRLFCRFAGPVRPYHQRGNGTGGPGSPTVPCQKCTLVMCPLALPGPDPSRPPRPSPKSPRSSWRRPTTGSTSGTRNMTEPEPDLRAGPADCTGTRRDRNRLVRLLPVHPEAAAERDRRPCRHLPGRHRRGRRSPPGPPDTRPSPTPSSGTADGSPACSAAAATLGMWALTRQAGFR